MPTNIGIGALGYGAWKVESTYNTAVTSSPRTLPILSDVKFMQPEVTQLEMKAKMGSIVGILPVAGANMNGPMDLGMYMHPELIGEILNFMIGAESTVTGSSAYTHTFKFLTAANTIGKSFTFQYADGSNTQCILSGCQISKLSLKLTKDGVFTVTPTIIGATCQTGQTRLSSFSYPSTTPYKIGDAALTITPNGVSAFSQLIHEVEIIFDANIQSDNHYLSSRDKKQSFFNGRPSVTVKLKVDAEQKFMDYAQAITYSKLLLALTNVGNIPSTSTPYSFSLEIPKMVLSKSTQIAASEEFLTMDLEYKGFAGSTTALTDAYAELIVVDGTATWA